MPQVRSRSSAARATMRPGEAVRDVLGRAGIDRVAPAHAPGADGDTTNPSPVGRRTALSIGRLPSRRPRGLSSGSGRPRVHRRPATSSRRRTSVRSSISSIPRWARRGLVRGASPTSSTARTSARISPASTRSCAPRSRVHQRRRDDGVAPPAAVLLGGSASSSSRTAPPAAARWSTATAISVPAVPVPADECVDTTGCGDAFQAAFTVEYFTHGDAAAALHVGSQAAAEVIRHVGATATECHP